MWGVNPHKTVSPQARRERTCWAFLILLFNILWKKKALYFKSEVHLVFILLSWREANVQNPQDKMWRKRLSFSNGNIKRDSSVSDFKIKSLFPLFVENYLSHQTYFFEVILNLDTSENLLSKGWFKKWNDWMPEESSFRYTEVSEIWL